MVLHIKDSAHLKQVLESAGDKLVVLDFHALWCGPCKMISPKLEDLATEMVETVVIAKVDVDECEDVAMEYQISSMPTFVFIKNKEVLDKFSGANYEKLLSLVNKHA